MPPKMPSVRIAVAVVVCVVDPVVVLFIAMVLAGAISYGGLPVKQYPNVQFPLVTVTVTQNGAAPSEMETQITRPVEDAVAGFAKKLALKEKFASAWQQKENQ